mmetsp:Transcript_9394/g.13069  ORF Transcript_9394/g.13069 Transcript_9394/m.13069 type:complete len:104 (+) Transcript_9394:433-744(+)
MVAIALHEVMIIVNNNVGILTKRMNEDFCDGLNSSCSSFVRTYVQQCNRFISFCQCIGVSSMIMYFVVLALDDMTCSAEQEQCKKEEFAWMFHHSFASSTHEI